MTRPPTEAASFLKCMATLEPSPGLKTQVHRRHIDLSYNYQRRSKMTALNTEMSEHGVTNNNERRELTAAELDLVAGGSELENTMISGWSCARFSSFSWGASNPPYGA